MAWHELAVCLEVAHEEDELSMGLSCVTLQWPCGGSVAVTSVTSSGCCRARSWPHAGAHTFINLFEDCRFLGFELRAAKSAPPLADCVIERQRFACVALGKSRGQGIEALRTSGAACPDSQSVPRVVLCMCIACRCMRWPSSLIGSSHTNHCHVTHTHTPSQTATHPSRVVGLVVVASTTEGGEVQGGRSSQGLGADGRSCLYMQDLLDTRPWASGPPCRGGGGGGVGTAAGLCRAPWLLLLAHCGCCLPALQHGARGGTAALWLCSTVFTPTPALTAACWACARSFGLWPGAAHDHAKHAPAASLPAEARGRMCTCLQCVEPARPPADQRRPSSPCIRTYAGRGRWA